MRDHSGSLAGPDLTEKSVKIPATHRGQPKQLVDYNDSRSITKQIIDDFEPETVKLIMPRPNWRNDFTGVNADGHSTKLLETYREAPKLDVDFDHNQTDFKRLLDPHNLKPVNLVTSETGMRTVQVNYSKGANEKLISRIRQPLPSQQPRSRSSSRR